MVIPHDGDGARPLQSDGARRQPPPESRPSYSDEDPAMPAIVRHVANYVSILFGIAAATAAAVLLAATLIR